MLSRSKCVEILREQCVICIPSIPWSSTETWSLWTCCWTSQSQASERWSKAMSCNSKQQQPLATTQQNSKSDFYLEGLCKFFPPFPNSRDSSLISLRLSFLWREEAPRMCRGSKSATLVLPSSKSKQGPGDRWPTRLICWSVSEVHNDIGKVCKTRVIFRRWWRQDLVKFERFGEILKNRICMCTFVLVLRLRLWWGRHTALDGAWNVDQLHIWWEGISSETLSWGSYAWCHIHI